MQAVAETYDVGVLVGRFQVPELHQGHKDLIQTVLDNHDKVIIFLGLSPLKASLSNPLDFEARKQMLLDEFPDVNVAYIEDVNNDQLWSRNLDKQITALTGPTQSVVLYGSRDSFIEHYTGKNPSTALESESYFSGTEVRKEVSRQSTRQSPDFRAGVVWTTFQRFPTSFQVVDVCIVDADINPTKVLLGRKEGEKGYRFIGGFVDPSDSSLEAAARREVQEETGLSITDPKYVGSYRIDDWRYANERDKMLTAVFVAAKQFGKAEANDDIVEIRWFDIGMLVDSDFVPGHDDIFNILIDAGVL